MLIYEERVWNKVFNHSNESPELQKRISSFNRKVLFTVQIRPEWPGNIPKSLSHRKGNFFIKRLHCVFGNGRFGIVLDPVGSVFRTEGFPVPESPLVQKVLVQIWPESQKAF